MQNVLKRKNMYLKGFQVIFYMVGPLRRGGGKTP